PRPRVDDPQVTAGEDGRAGLRPFAGRDRRRRPAEENAERVGGEEGGRVPPDPPAGDAADQRVLDRSRAERQRARHDDADGEREQDPDDAPHASSGGNGRFSAGRGGSRQSGIEPASAAWSAKNGRMPARWRTASSRSLRASP